jgi:uncharacterized protein YuzE
MRILHNHAADMLYVEFGAPRSRPAPLREVAEGTLAEVDEDGRLVGVTVVCLHRDWSADAAEILARHTLSDADADRLREVATASA